MSARRIVANIAAPYPGAAHAFYGEILGLDLAMDLGWIRTYTGSATPSIQISFMREGGSDTPVPDISIEVDDLDEMLGKLRLNGFEPEYGPVVEPWGVRRFFVRDPFGKLVNVLTHAGGDQ